MPHNLAIGKTKSKENLNYFNPKTIMESTNTSLKNNVYIK